MNLLSQKYTRLFILISCILLLAACSAGGERFTTETPAGFWYGLWHGIISFLSLLVHLFNDSVLVYERNNSGGWYDFGFLLGVVFVWGSGCHVKCKSAQRKKRDREWEEIGNKVEVKIMHKLKDWAEKEDMDDQDNLHDRDWEEIWPKVEKKLKRKIREWAEKE